MFRMKLHLKSLKVSAVDFKSRSQLVWSWYVYSWARIRKRKRVGKCLLFVQRMTGGYYHYCSISHSSGGQKMTLLQQLLYISAYSVYNQQTYYYINSFHPNYIDHLQVGKQQLQKKTTSKLQLQSESLESTSSNTRCIQTNRLQRIKDFSTRPKDQTRHQEECSCTCMTWHGNASGNLSIAYG